MPFLLYDQVTMDRLSFECLLGQRPSLYRWRPHPGSVKILEHLAADGHVVLDDYSRRLDTPNVTALIDQMNVLDLSDPNLLQPATDSLYLWMQFYKDLFGATDLTLQKFHLAVAALSGRAPPHRALGYLYECVSDINRVLIVAQVLQQPVYDWEDYCRYYRYKFMRVAQRSPDRPPGRTLGELFDVFIPNFEIRTYEELQDIRSDNRLDSVRDLVGRIGDARIDKDIVLQANADVLSIKRRLDTFGRYVGLGGYALSVLPGPVGNVLGDVANHLAKRWLERKVAWQMFFVERAVEYRESHVRRACEGKDRARPVEP